MKQKLTNIVLMLANLSKGWLAAIAICVAMVAITLAGVVGRLHKPAPAPQPAPVVVEDAEADENAVSPTGQVEVTAEDTDEDDTIDTTADEAPAMDPSVLEDPTPLLEELMGSDDPEDWLLAAKQPDATSSDLEELARRAALLDFYMTFEEDIQVSCDIMDAIASHKALTSAALRSFLASPHTEVWLELARQETADEDTLVLLARQTARLDQMELNSSYAADEEQELAIAKALASNPASTAKVMAELQCSPFDSVKQVKLT